MEERFQQKAYYRRYSNALEMAEEFKQKVEERLGCAQVFIAEMGASLAVHGGQGMLGIAACALDSSL